MKIKVINVGPGNRKSPNWFQCSILMADWTKAIMDEIFSQCEKMTGIKSERFMLGSGYLQPGMKEIFYLV